MTLYNIIFLHARPLFPPDNFAKELLFLILTTLRKPTILKHYLGRIIKVKTHDNHQDHLISRL